ncbi:MAG TPA: hypothetical protein VHB48_10035 [Chitinophagaceae bacterium]|nr:hypothetical protein [Chitinophagaceae bacterium]
MLSWQNITVQQFQDVYRLSEDKNLDDMQRLEKVIAILYDKTEKQVGEMTIKEFTAHANQCAFIMQSQNIPGKPVKYIRCGKHRYGIQYNPAKLRHRQYVEILHFGDKPIENMHLIMASLVQPVKFRFLWRHNRANMHSRIAQDMLDAPVVHVYHAAVFFCKLYVSLIAAIKDYLVAEMMKENKITKEQAEKLVDISRNAMAGFIQPAKWQSLSV